MELRGKLGCKFNQIDVHFVPSLYKLWDKAHIANRMRKTKEECLSDDMHSSINIVYSIV